MHADITVSDSRTVLIADDDADVRELARAALYGLGCAIRLVRRGDDALLAIRSQPPRLLVLDVSMPGISGLSVCRRVKTSGLAAGTLVLLISASSGPEDVAAAYEAGADDFLPKPFSPAELAARVEQLLATEERLPLPLAD